jgi:hypothetical protein
MRSSWSPGRPTLPGRNLSKVDFPPTCKDRAQHVRPEGGLLGANSGSRDRRKVNDGIPARQALDRLAVFGQVGDQGRCGRLGGRDDVDREHVVVVLEQGADDRPSGLSARARDDDSCHG